MSTMKIMVLFLSENNIYLTSLILFLVKTQLCISTNLKLLFSMSSVISEKKIPNVTYQIRTSYHAIIKRLQVFKNKQVKS